MTQNTVYYISNYLAVDGLVANGSLGLPGQVLATDGTNIFWTDAAAGNTDITLDGGNPGDQSVTVYDGGGPYDTPSGTVDAGIEAAPPTDIYDGGLPSAGTPTTTFDGGAITGSPSTTLDGGGP